MGTDQDVRNAVVNYLLRKQVTGSHKRTVDTVLDEARIASHDEGRAKDVIGEMLSDPATPIEGYGGASRRNVRLTSLGDGADYLEANDGDLPFGWE
jgi:hypothetical protein